MVSILAAWLAFVGVSRNARAQDPEPEPSEELPAETPSTSAPALAEPAPPSNPAPSERPPLAGFHNGLFFLRDESDVFRLYVMGRVHVDGIAWFGPGITSLGPDSALKTTLQIRRARPELAGEFFQDWQWLLSVDLAPTATDNPAARTASRSCTVDPASGAESCVDAMSSVEAPLQRPAVTDAYVNYGPSRWTNLQIGQYLLPFTMENRVADNTTPFLERSLVSRGLGAPLTRDLGVMFWGQEEDALVYYTAGLYTGDGPNRTNSDNRFDVVGRVFTRPFASSHGELLEYAQIGVSGRYGSRDPKLVGYDAPSLTTQGGYAFWRATYRDSQSRLVHIIPSAEQEAIAGELYIPIDRFDLTSEVVYSVSNTREAVDGYQLSPFTERTTRLAGYAYYAQLGAWVFGSRDIIGGSPSYGKPLHVDLRVPQKTPARGLQLLAKLEQLHVTYSGTRQGALDPKTPLGDIDVTAIAFGANFWATRHLRVGLNYTYYDFPGSEPVSASTSGGPVQTSEQRAQAPAQALAKGVENEARDNGHSLHELQLRVGVQF
jgi:hypothetical protein